MTQNNNILQELKELNSSLAELSIQNIYSVPNGYFEGLAGQVLNRIKAIEANNAGEELGYLSPLLSYASRQIPYVVPVGYFEGLEERLMQSVRNSNDYQTATEELETLSPLLSGLKKQMPYSVPQGYFENIAETVSKESNNHPATKVISISSRKWFRYAAAAVITGVIVMAGFMVLNKDKVDPGTDSHAWVEKSVKKVSSESIEKFVELTEEENLVASADTKSPQEVKELVKDVPESEIQSLLNDTQLLDDTNNQTASDDETMMN